jgi:hypothetical protein
MADRATRKEGTVTRLPLPERRIHASYDDERTVRHRSRGRLAIASGLVIAALAAFAVAPAIASAASVKLSGSQLTYTAGAKESNAVTVTKQDAATIFVRDTGIASIGDGDGAGGCTVVGAQATCPAAAVTQMLIQTTDQSDSVSVSATLATADTIEGGKGDDSLSSGAGRTSSAAATVPTGSMA